MKTKLILASVLSVTAAIIADGWIGQLRLSTHETVLLSIFIGSLPNFIAVFLISIPFLFSQYDYLKSLLGLTLGVCFYEIMQVHLAWGTFDLFDILFSVSGGAAGWLLYRLLTLFKVHPVKLLGDG
ncbi:hypothetical protein [Planctobacterium marinum]|uniref:VanZ-like domain-containing protein n=1 Tax=Planctobacterium marinum TaxID=1631968 RepID=A0AA48HTM5_9ALTE|nr:hypothetical protein MACH26_40080 [Planctobacterium marinum]